MRFAAILSLFIASTGFAEDASADTSKSSGGLNTLTPEEIAEGWVLLFDGKTKFGWKAEDPKMEDHWVVEDGALTCSSDVGFNHLKSNAVFSDFVLKLEFRVNTKGNSGIFFRGANGVPFVGAKIDGYEAQVDDNDPRGLSHQTGSLYDVAGASKLIPGENEWRTYEIYANGDHLVLKVNGETTLDIHNDKFRSGHIGLQHHHVGNKIEFRNIKLKPLGLHSIFNGSDLAGWRQVDRPGGLKAEWSVRDGLLHVDVPPMEGVKQGGQGQLETESEYSNFVLQMDIRVNGKFFNSGVFFRSKPEQVWQGYESQIRNQFFPTRDKPVDYGTGGLYNLVPTREVVSNDNEFFTKTIVANGRHFSVWVNGYPVVDFEDTRPEKASARNGYFPGPGVIALQSHDPTTNLDFRNIRIAELP